MQPHLLTDMPSTEQVAKSLLTTEELSDSLVQEIRAVSWLLEISAIYTNQVHLLNQCIIIFTRKCNIKTDIKDSESNATHFFWTNVISGIYDNSFSERKTKLIETNFVVSINAIGIQYVLPVTK